jgi:hypothetical protein
MTTDVDINKPIDVDIYRQSHHSGDDAMTIDVAAYNLNTLLVRQRSSIYKQSNGMSIEQAPCTRACMRSPQHYMLLALPFGLAL